MNVLSHPPRTRTAHVHPRPLGRSVPLARAQRRRKATPPPRGPPRAGSGCASAAGCSARGSPGSPSRPRAGRSGMTNGPGVLLKMFSRVVDGFGAVFARLGRCWAFSRLPPARDGADTTAHSVRMGGQPNPDVRRKTQAQSKRAGAYMELQAHRTKTDTVGLEAQHITPRVSAKPGIPAPVPPWGAAVLRCSWTDTSPRNPFLAWTANARRNQKCGGAALQASSCRFRHFSSTRWWLVKLLAFSRVFRRTCLQWVARTHVSDSFRTTERI